MTLTEDIQDGGLTADQVRSGQVDAQLRPTLEGFYCEGVSVLSSQVKTFTGSTFQPITDKKKGGQSDVIINNNNSDGQLIRLFKIKVFPVVATGVS